MEWMLSSLVYLWDQLTVTTVWNSGETGDTHSNFSVTPKWDGEWHSKYSLQIIKYKSFEKT